MTQARLFSDDEAGPPPTTYLLDTCVPLWLDCINKEPTGKCRYSPEESKAIWAGLEDLARTGRLLIIGQVKTELEKWHRAAKERLSAHPRHRAPNLTKDIMLRFKEITSAHSGLVRPEKNNDPADPWLIAYAEEFHHTIVTEEIPAIQHTQKWKQKQTYIPDVCTDRQIEWCSLREMAVREKWLPGD